MDTGRCLSGPRFRASHRALAGLGLSASIAIAGCAKQDDALAWYSQPNDPQVYAMVLDRCLSETRGPQQAHYNDWDEAIKACGAQAENVSRYCPEGARCVTSSVSHAQVRAVLASGMETRRDETPKSGSVAKP